MRAAILILTLCVTACDAPPENQQPHESKPRTHAHLSDATGPWTSAARDYFVAIADDDSDTIAAYLDSWFDRGVLDQRGLDGWTLVHLEVARQIGPLSTSLVVENSPSRLEVLTQLDGETDWLSWTFLAADGDTPRLRGVRVVNAAPPETWAPIFRTADANTLANELQRRLPGPAIGVAIVHADGRIDSSVQGLRRHDDTTPATRSDLFHLGSCTKSVTALLVGTLVEDGLVSWNDTVDQLLGNDFEIDATYKDATLFEIARHRAGLAGHSKDIAQAIERYADLPGPPRSQRATYLQDVLAQPSQIEAGRTHYSNAGFTLLAHICERLLDRPYEELVVQRVLRPHGIATAHFGWPGNKDSPDGIWGHSVEEDELIVFEEGTRLGAFLAPAGDLALSIDDFARVAAVWADSTRHGPLLETAPGSSYGAGVGVGTRNGHRFVGHAGSTGVYWSKFRAWPDLGIAAVVATNGPVDSLTERAVNAAFDAVVAAQ